MRFEPPRAFLESSPLSGTRRRFEDHFPPEIAFLAAFFVSLDVLREAAALARLEGVDAARSLIAGGGISETLYYQCLASHLGVPFVGDWPCLAPSFPPATALMRGSIKLDDDERAPWLVAPQGDCLTTLLVAHERRGVAMPRVAITTPSHLAALIRLRADTTLADAASQALPDAAPLLSAKGVFDPKARIIMALMFAACLYGTAAGSRFVLDVFGILFLASIVFRLFVCAAGLERETPPEASLSDAAAPLYTVLVPLYDEPGMVPGLVAALRRLDYPRLKLEVLFLVEADDRATLHALKAADLPPGFCIIVAPDGAPRTKPRALNIGLSFARGSLVTVYDAEDRPEANQLRLAAERFARAPKTLACLQARLAIANGDNALLARLFAIDYAALFDLFNVGLGRLRMPMALGGTSNHFRADVLRAVGGWDAWNVTEDADLGLRLARFGYDVETLASTTWEEAPEELAKWFKQRRRWTKGWMQTLLVLARDAPSAARDCGPARALFVALMLTNLVTGPLLSPIFVCLVTRNYFVVGLPAPHGAMAVGEATLAFTVMGCGLVSILWCAYAGFGSAGSGAS